MYVCSNKHMSPPVSKTGCKNNTLAYEFGGKVCTYFNRDRFGWVFYMCKA